MRRLVLLETRLAAFGLGFALTGPDNIDVAAYSAVLVWCEAFGVFVTTAAYRGWVSNNRHKPLRALPDQQRRQ